jgi:hypothetical protein
MALVGNFPGTCIRLATSSDAEEIGTLRVSEYRASSDFINPKETFIRSLSWSEDDNNAQVLTVWRNSTLVATMRCEKIPDQSLALIHFDGMPPPTDHIEWPAFVLRAAATRSASQKSGLNSVMRLYFIKALIGSNVRRLYGYVPRGSGRTRLMETIGYEFLNRTDQDSDLPSKYPWTIAWLNLPARAYNAVRVLERLACQEMDEIPWASPSLSLDRFATTDVAGSLSVAPTGEG